MKQHVAQARLKIQRMNEKSFLGPRLLVITILVVVPIVAAISDGSNIFYLHFIFKSGCMGILILILGQILTRLDRPRAVYDALIASGVTLSLLLLYIGVLAVPIMIIETCSDPDFFNKEHYKERPPSHP